MSIAFITWCTSHWWYLSLGTVVPIIHAAHQAAPVQAWILQMRHVGDSTCMMVQARSCSLVSSTALAGVGGKVGQFTAMLAVFPAACACAET